MRILHRNRVAEVSVSYEFVDHNEITWEYKAAVQISTTHEILGVTLDFLEAFGADGNPVKKEDHLSLMIVENIKDQAARRAIEKIQSIDFEAEEVY